MQLIEAARFSHLAYASPVLVEAARAGVESTPAEMRLLLKDAAKVVYRTDPCSDVQAYEIAMRPDEAGGVRLVTAVRGTNSLADAFHDLNALLAPFPNPADAPARVHSGLLRQYGALEELVRSDAEAHLAAAEGNTVEFTGHSAGAAVSCMLALATAIKYPAERVSWVGFGCPRPGDAAFRSLFAEYVKDAISVCHGRDPIVKLAPGGVYGHPCDLVRYGRADPFPELPSFLDAPDHDIARYVKAVESGDVTAAAVAREPWCRRKIREVAAWAVTALRNTL